MKQEYKNLFAQFSYYPFEAEVVQHGPLVSVLMSYYCQADCIEEGLHAILAQKYQNWELIIVSDASPDHKIEKILTKFPDPRIHYVYQEKNSGAAIARTTAFRHAKGEYIICFDPDDIMAPTYISALMAEALSAAKPYIVFSDHITFGHMIEYRKGALLDEESLTRLNWIVGTALASRTIWEVTGGQSPDPIIRYGCQDWEFWFHAFKKIPNLRVAHVPLPLFLYKQHNTSISSKRNSYDYLIRWHIAQKHGEVLDKYNARNKFVTHGILKSFYDALRKRNIPFAIEIIKKSSQIINIWTFFYLSITMTANYFIKKVYSSIFKSSFQRK